MYLHKTKKNMQYIIKENNQHIILNKTNIYVCVS